MTADAGCGVTYAYRSLSSELMASNGDGRLLVRSPNLVVFNGGALWISVLTAIEADGGVGGTGSFGFEFTPLWPLNHGWVFGVFAINPHTGLPASLDLEEAQSPSFPDPPNSDKVGGGNAPFLLRPVPSGGLMTVSVDIFTNPQDQFCDFKSDFEFTVPISSQLVHLDGGSSIAHRFGCLGNDQTAVAAVNAGGEGLVYTPANGFRGAQLWRISVDGVARQVQVPLDEPVVRIIALTDARFALASTTRWLGVLGAQDSLQPPPCWLVARPGQDLRPFPSGSGYWRELTEPVDGGDTFDCTTRIEEVAADGTSCRTYEVGSSDGTRCTSRPLVRGVDGTVGQLSPSCEVLTWPHARP